MAHYEETNPLAKASMYDGTLQIMRTIGILPVSLPCTVIRKFQIFQDCRCVSPLGRLAPHKWH